MKKKIYKFVSVTVIAVAMVVSFQMSKAQSSSSALTMENVKALAMADDEGSRSEFDANCIAVWENLTCVVNGTTYSYAKDKQ